MSNITGIQTEGIRLRRITLEAVFLDRLWSSQIVHCVQRARLVGIELDKVCFQ